MPFSKKILNKKAFAMISTLLLAMVLIAGCTSAPASNPAPARQAIPAPTAQISEQPAPEEPTPPAAQPPVKTPTPPASAAVKELNIEAYNFGFKMNDVQIKKGDKVRLTLTVTSGFHSVAIPAFNADTGTVNAGESKTVEFTADKSGSFPFKCNVYCGSGHRDMTGTLVVS